MHGFNVSTLPLWLRLSNSMKDLENLANNIRNTSLAPLMPFLEESFIANLNHGDLKRWLETIENAPDLTPSSIDLGEIITIGSDSDANSADLGALDSILTEFIPWRKGPFNLFGIELDTEWKSNLKWTRLKDKIAPLNDRQVLDVGSGNGYYSLRMIEAGARQVIGIDPHLAYVIQFWLLKRYIPYIDAYVLPLTLEQIPSSLPLFDTVFSMGVIYHRRSPIDHLMQLKSCLRRGGQLVIESIIVDGEEGYSLTPGKRYARMTNVWFLPSILTLMNWLTRCGYVDINLVDESTTSWNEQRKTQWMPFDSLDNALLPDDLSKTIEGYPAPKRAVITAIKP